MPVRNAVVIEPTDNVATVLTPIAAGTAVRWGDDGCVVAVEAIPMGHKVALAAILPGEPILKYGHAIGVASMPIAVGQHVHTQNLTGQEV